MSGDASDVAIRQGCCFGTFDHYCGKPAAIHVWIRDDLGSMSCAEHASWWDTHAHSDQHPIVDACGLPGTTWIFAVDGEPGRCVVDDVANLDLLGLAAMQAEVTR